MASPSRRKSGSATRTFLFSSIARTAIWFRQPNRASRYCASPSSCQLWKNPLVGPWRAGEAETKAAACCNYRTGARRWVLRTGEKGLLAPSAPACPRLNRPRCRPDLALSICPQYALCSSLLDDMIQRGDASRCPTPIRGRRPEFKQNSLFLIEYSLLGLRTFPVTVRREFNCKPLNQLAD